MKEKLQNNHYRRTIALMLLCILIFVFASMRVFDYQIVNTDEYLAIAEKSTEATVSVSAARGEIVDRNGIPFTQNKATFDVEFDYSFIKAKEINKTIFNLIKTFEGLGEEWIDSLPITKTAPYEFTDDEVAVSRLKKKLDLREHATAENCMTALYEINDYLFKKDMGKAVEYQPYTEEYRRKIAGVRYEMIQRSFSAYTPRYTFAEDVKPTTVAFIKELSDDYKGVFITQKASRTYISGDVASHLIGSLGPIYAEDADYYKEKGYSMNEVVGKNGIEYAFEDYLRGKNGTMKVIKNNRGDVVDVVQIKAPVAGNTVQLTIDYNFQKQIQQILADYIDDFNKTNKLDKHSNQAAVVVLDAKTGGVLASVSYPYYDINDYKTNYKMLEETEGKPLNNYAIKGLYRPGSTFKPIVAAAGLTEGTLNKNTEVYCDGAYHFWPKWNPPPKCLSIGHRNVSLDVVHALQFSCNVFFYDSGRVLGIDRINQYANYFGLGVETGLEVSSPKGILSSKETSAAYGQDWEEGHVIQAAIGQLDTQITPLQMAVEAMTLANRGTRFETHLLKGLLSYDTKTVVEGEKTKVASKFELSNENFNLISQGMILASQGVGGADNLKDLGYNVAVKTGTPQVTTTKTNNAFVAFAPVENPEIAISCMVVDGYNSIKLVRRIIDAYEANFHPKAEVEPPVVSSEEPKS